MIEQPSFFDEPAQEGGASCTQAGESPVTYRFCFAPWEAFCSWPRDVQMRYCAARDREAIAQETDPEWRAFYEERAAAYDELAEGATR